MERTTFKSMVLLISDKSLTALLYMMIIRCYCYILVSTSQFMYRNILLLLMFFEPNIELIFSFVSV